MDEWVDILDDNGNFTGRTALKSEAHKKGLLHPTVHIWLYTKSGRILIQQRAKYKDTHPLLWDVSVAGHVGAGEEVEASAVREIQEEIGLSVQKNELPKWGVFTSRHRHRDDFIDHELHHIFLCELKVPLTKLCKQESEVETLALISLIRFAEETWGMANPKKYVPHGLEYYAMVTREIKKRL